MQSAPDSLRQLARLFGVATSYTDSSGQVKEATSESLLRVLRSLGAAIADPTGAADALRAKERAIWQRPLQPVLLAWDGAPTEILLRVPAKLADEDLVCTVQLESGDSQSWTIAPIRRKLRESAEVCGVAFLAQTFVLPQYLALGYHHLSIDIGGARAEALLLAAPTRSYMPADSLKTWGVFAPLYGIHSERSWGAGDFADLEALLGWVQGLGGGVVATLPLLAAFLDEPFEPGPYSPASRLFWNEFYLDVGRIPEFPLCPSVWRIVESAEFLAEVQALRAAPLVDHRRQMALKRRVLSELVRAFFATTAERRATFDQFVSDRPQLADYARFRAAGERLRQPWPAWPQRLRDGEVREEDYNEGDCRYHLYVQWLCHEQLHQLAGKAKAAGPGLYLDLPLGVNPDSYDVWRERSLFARDMAGGAPPDPFFAKGQNWGFPPQYPDQMREQGYRYLIACLRHHMQFGGLLRIDHLMGLHRFFWVPHGMEARDGVYVQYPAEELYAVFTLESQRNGTVLVGEDLGTVPPEVPPAMARHHVNRMYVLQYELKAEPDPALPEIFAGSVASLNTHDMPPFAAFCQGLDIADRLDLGILDASVVDREYADRRALLDRLVALLKDKGFLNRLEDTPPQPPEVLRACLELLGSGTAQVVLASLDDCWLETEPQNVPGTWKERPNWRRRSRYPLEVVSQMATLTELLHRLDDRVKAKT